MLPLKVMEAAGENMPKSDGCACCPCSRISSRACVNRVIAAVTHCGDLLLSRSTSPQTPPQDHPDHPGPILCNPMEDRMGDGVCKAANSGGKGVSTSDESNIMST
eukprot:1184894-Prorocentrum_minimum.AAC.1